MGASLPAGERYSLPGASEAWNTLFSAQVRWLPTDIHCSITYLLGCQVGCCCVIAARCGVSLTVAAGRRGDSQPGKGAGTSINACEPPTRGVKRAGGGRRGASLEVHGLQGVPCSPCCSCCCCWGSPSTAGVAFAVTIGLSRAPGVSLAFKPRHPGARSAPSQALYLRAPTRSPATGACRAQRTVDQGSQPAACMQAA